MIMTQEVEYSKLVFSTAREATSDSDSVENAVDLLSDAIALLISESPATLEQAVDHIKEAVPIFEDADVMAKYGSARLS
jgi:hypothetical protein